MVNHNIDHNTYAKIGETLLRWAEADGYLGNSINWMSGFPPNSAEAKDVYKLAMKDKVKSLEKCRDSRRGTTTKDIDTLLEDIRQVMNLEWKKERDSIAHGTPLQLKNGAVVLRTDKGYEFRIDHVDVALMHARCISNLAVQLNVRLAAPVTKNIFPIRGMLLLLGKNGLETWTAVVPIHRKVRSQIYPEVVAENSLSVRRRITACGLRLWLVTF